MIGFYQWAREESHWLGRKMINQPQLANIMPHTPLDYLCLVLLFFFLVMSKKRWNEARKMAPNFAYLINFFLVAADVRANTYTKNWVFRILGCSPITLARTLSSTFRKFPLEIIFFLVRDGFVPNPSKYLNNVLWINKEGEKKNNIENRKRFNFN